MLRVAQDLDADFVVFGSFTSDGKTLTARARILRVSPTALQPELQETGTLDSLMDLQTKLVWRLLAANDSSYRVTLADFSKAQSALRLDAFEHYVRGLLATEDEVRIREMREAARLEPTWANPDFALGEVYFSRRDCDSALTWFGRVPKTHQRYVEAVFATGVCRLQMNQPDRAEEVFTSLQDSLAHGTRGDVATGASGADLPEILNNLAVARARQGKNPAAQTDLRKAADIDPDEDDYPFNLGLIALRSGDFAGAAKYFQEAATREPDNPEDRALTILALEKAGKKAEADQERETAVEAFGPNGLPAVKLDAKGDALARLDRVKPELDVTALRLEIEHGEKPVALAASDASAPDTIAGHLRRGHQEFAAGQADAAESEFRAVLVTDPGNASAHRGLGEIARRHGKLDDAVKELQASLASRDSAVVRTILARVYLEQKKNAQAIIELEQALKIAPNYAEAKTLLEHLKGAKAAGGAK